jgi:hypothetical protein
MNSNLISIVELSTASSSISTRNTPHADSKDFLSYSGIEKSGGSSRTGR